ncbi:MAG: nitroreductase family protein [Thermoplasmata archaeon]
MDFNEVVKRRRSVRKFTREDVTRKKVEKIVDIGHAAPSAGNLQARDFILVRKQETKEKLVECAYGQSFIADAPWVVVVCANKKRSAEKYGKRGRELYAIQDATAAVENILLAVTNEGLASVWVGAFEDGCVSSVLNIPEKVRPIALLPIGHPGAESAEPSKIRTEDLIHEEEW